MFNKLILLFVCLANSFSGQAMANGYQFETGVRYSDKDDNLFNPTLTLATIRMYLEPVDYTGKPYKEEAFLARKSSVMVSLGQLENEIDLGPASVDIDSTLIGIDVEYARAVSPFVFGLGFETAEGDEKYFNQDVDANTDSVTVSVAYYADPFTKWGFVVSETEVKLASDTGRFELNTSAYNLEYVTLQRLDSLKYYSVEARFGRSEIEDVDLDLIQVGGNYYYSLSTSFGGLLGVVSSEQKDAEGYSILFRVRHFVDPYTSLAFSYDKFSNDEDSDSDAYTTRLDFLHRF